MTIEWLQREMIRSYSFDYIYFHSHIKHPQCDKYLPIQMTLNWMIANMAEIHTLILLLSSLGLEMWYKTPSKSEIYIYQIRNTNQFVRIKKKKNIKQNRILWILNKIWFTCYCDINIVRFIPRKDTEWWLTNMIWWWLTATEDLTKIRLYFLHQFTKYPKIEILQRIRTAI